MKKYVKTIDLLMYLDDDIYVIECDSVKYYSWDNAGIPSDVLYDTHLTSIQRIFVGYSDCIMFVVEYDYR